VQLANTLVGEFDVIDILTILTARSVEVLGATAAGILLADPQHHLRVMAASSEQIELLELFQVQNDEGPCLDSYNDGEVISAEDLRRDLRWPSFAAVCVAAGFPSVIAIPLRLDTRTLGCLNLFMSEPAPLQEADRSLAQAFADVATITIVQDEALRAAAIREATLQHALDSRIAIEQAKGMIAQSTGGDMDSAFAQLRNYSRGNNRQLTQVAIALIHGTLPLGDVTDVTGKRHG
jgi:GAF domain-containing protein